MNGEIFNPTETLMLKPCGEVQGPNGRYKILIDTQGQPVVMSMQTQKKCRFAWTKIVEMAVENGVDDGIRHYLMECEGGRMESGKITSVPRQ